VWNIANFTLFVIRVKWDKKLVWEVKRRYPDFVLLVNILEQTGLAGNQDFREFVADFSRPCASSQAEYAMVYKQIKGLNQFLHVCTTIPAVKTSGPFRSFITHGQTKLVGEKFNTMLSIYDFDILACVGKGSFGKVFQVRKKDNGNIYALKVLLKKDIKQDSQIRHTKTERQILGDIVHPFVCALRYAFQSDTKLYLVLDFFSGGELGIHLEKGKFNEAQARFYCAELILGLAHLHSQSIVYRDLKPGNILLEADGHIKIADFGLSKKFKRGEIRAKTFCGTPVYMAPEIIERQPYSFPVDWWALGVIMFEMMTGDPPFIETNMKRLFKLVLSTEVVFPPDMSPAAKSLIGGLLKKNPADRLGANGSKSIQDHEFFQGLDWRALYNKGVTVPFVPTPRRDSRGPGNVWPELIDEKLDTTKSVSTGFAHKQFTQFTYNQAETYDTLPNSMRMQEVSSFHGSASLDTLELKSQRIESTNEPMRRMGIGEFAAAALPR
jgi:serine/threonine protein kinase